MTSFNPPKIVSASLLVEDPKLQATFYLHDLKGDGCGAGFTTSEAQKEGFARRRLSYFGSKPSLFTPLTNSNNPGSRQMLEM